jgi:hypothetical protein
MANPNIVNVSRILANTVSGVLSTSNTALVTNPASSGSVYKVNIIKINNIDGANSATFNLVLNNGGVSVDFMKTIAVAADTSLTALDKNESLYLKENSILAGSANTAGDLSYVISLEQIYAA